MHRSAEAYVSHHRREKVRLRRELGGTYATTSAETIPRQSGLSVPAQIPA
jgi:hypothetical protein